MLRSTHDGGETFIAVEEVGGHAPDRREKILVEKDFALNVGGLRPAADGINAVCAQVPNAPQLHEAA